MRLIAVPDNLAQDLAHYVAQVSIVQQLLHLDG